ncbi:Inosine/uridine-preferring nucleoside hydrolase [Pseudomonas savastanoi pv. nerii]|nr:Inosine/uridine-preferring nucleoside hydrolase [Pseudomonas savastanoi pv. nerii]
MTLMQFSRQFIRGALLLSILSSAAVQAAEKRDLIIVPTLARTTSLRCCWRWRHPKN